MALSEIQQRVEEEIGIKRGLLLTVGLVCMLLGLLSAGLPLRLYGYLIRFVGVFSLASGAIKALQLLIGRSEKTRQRSWPVILCHVAVDVVMGLLLINYWRFSTRILVTAFALLFLAEGLILLYMALRSPTSRSRRGLTLVSGITTGIGVVVLFRLVPDPIRLAGFFVGLKLLAFGGALTWIAVRALRNDPFLMYEAVVPIPVVGELYAVYFGTAFHLGVVVGHGEVVHYLNDNHVYRVTWATFLEGRDPEHWTYPDLAPVPVNVVVATALGEVGKTYPYNLLTFNCEHFAIYCKSGGKTYYSKYGQVAGGFANVSAHPVIGMVTELNTRIVEWMAFHFGGPAGKHVSLAIRRIGAAVTAWILSLDPGAQTARSK
jgi:uncharacterized membrane protein HdeD (DUF308 family)